MKYTMTGVLAFFFLQVGWAQVPDTGWTSVPVPPKVDSLAQFRVDSVEFQIRNAFDDAKVHTPVDAMMYSILNKLHIETRQSVVQKLLLFEAGDTVNLKSLIESERLLRTQKIFSDAKVESIQGVRGENILRVTTSDNWTTTLPVALSKPGDEWIWSVGVLENNLLGLGQSIGVYYGHDEERDSWLLRYGNPHFLFPNNRLLASYAKLTDGYSGDFFIGKPLLARSRNEWSYTIEALSQKLNRTKYWSDAHTPAKHWLTPEESAGIPLVNIQGDSIKFREYEPGARPNPVLAWDGVRQDSLSIRFGHSYGSDLKYFFRGVYDFNRLAVDQNPKLRLQTFAENGKFWRLDSSAGKLDEFLPRKGDSRVGMSLTISRLRYTKQMNFHRIKWTEDVDKGWNLSLHASKNISALGASDDRWFLTGSTAMSVGSGWHHLSLKTSVQSYLNSDHQSEEMYGKLNGEYILKPSPLFATVLNGQMDTWINSPRGNQLYLGGLDGLNGLPSAILAGQARFYAGLEQRWFPAIEIGTVVPVFTSFVNAGDVNAQLNDFDPGHAQVVAGFGARLGLSKSVEGVINHFNMGWAVRGPNSGTWSPLISWLAEITL